MQAWKKFLASSTQGMASGVAIGSLGLNALPLLIFSVLLDSVAIGNLRRIGVSKEVNKSKDIATLCLLPVLVNGGFSLIGVRIAQTFSPLGSIARRDFYAVAAEPLTKDSVNRISEKIDFLSEPRQSYWLSTDQLHGLAKKRKTVEKTKELLQGDAKIVATINYLISTPVNTSNYKNILDITKSVETDSRTKLVATESQRKSAMQSRTKALKIASEEYESSHPTAYEATITYNWVDAPSRVIRGSGFVRNGVLYINTDDKCSLKGEPGQDGYGACSVVMAGKRPVSLLSWNPVDGFVLIKASFGKPLKNPGSGVTENPFLVEYYQRMDGVMKDFRRERELGDKYCRKEKGSARDECYGKF